MSKITGTTPRDIVWQCPSCEICTMARSQDQAISNIKRYWELQEKPNRICTHYHTKPRKPALRINL